MKIQRERQRSRLGCKRRYYGANLCDLGSWACPEWFRRIMVRVEAPSPSRTTKLLVLTLANTSAVLSAAAQPTIGPLHHSAQWATHAQDAQHTGVSPVASQGLAKVHWHVPVDLAPPADEIFVHYSSPVITAKNTVIVPVKTGTSSFRVQAHDGATGKEVWTLSTAYQPPFAAFMPGWG